MKPIFLTCSALLLLAFTSSAEDKPNCIWVKHKNNTESCVLLESSPQVVFNGDFVNIGTRSLRLEDVVSYRFGNVDKTLIDENALDNGFFVFGDNTIEIKDQKGFAQIEIFNTTGGLVKQLDFPSGVTTASIDISQLNPGVYFLNVSNKSIKFVKR